MQLGEEAKDEVRDGSRGRELREEPGGGTCATGAYGERCGGLDGGLDDGLYGGRDVGEIKKGKDFFSFQIMLIFASSYIHPSKTRYDI